jgi:hypothetical protein
MREGKLNISIREFREIMKALERRTIKKYGLNAKHWFRGNHVN